MTLLAEKNITVEISSVISNVTVVGFADFYKKFNSYKFRIECVYNPNFLSPHILDPVTKEHVQTAISESLFEQRDLILSSLITTPTAQEKQDLQKFLIEFVKRRPGLTLDVFPKTFIEWLNNVV
jgi:hypothetical protein